MCKGITRYCITIGSEGGREERRGGGKIWAFLLDSKLLLILIQIFDNTKKTYKSNSQNKISRYDNIKFDHQYTHHHHHEWFYRTVQNRNPISSLSLRGKISAIGEKMLKGQLTTTTVLNLETKKATTYKYQKQQYNH